MDARKDHNRHWHHHRLSGGISTAALVLGLIAGVPALAATESASNTLAAADLAGSSVNGSSVSDIIVTGSRIVRRDFVSDSPIVTVTDDSIRNTGQLTLEKTLSQLPQFGLGENANQTGYNTTGQASLNLRSLGTFRNLVLLDGKRLQPSNTQQVVDLNTIPTALVESIEVITGGASAVYGSDAVAGVVNIKTKQNMQGVELDAFYGVSDEGDGAVAELTGTVGGNFADDRGNAVLSVSYSHRDPIGYRSRKFFRQNEGGTDLRLPTGVYLGGGNQPTQAAIDALFSQYGVAPGSVTPASGLSFNADGTLFSASNGVFNYRGSQGGLLYDTGRQVNNLNTFLTLQAPMERWNSFGRVTYDVSDNVTAFAQANFSDYKTKILVEPGNTSLSIPITNAFIPASLRALLASRPDPDGNVQLEKRFQEAGPRVTDRKLTTWQVLGGLKGPIEAIDGSWEAYASHGKTSIRDVSPGSVLRSSLSRLINAPDGGDSICAGGYNPFGINPLSDACSAYLVAAPIRTTDLTQDVIEANLQGKITTLPAGDLRFAVGAAYRRNSYATTPDHILSTGDVVGVPFTQASNGSSNVKEGYAELLLPLLSDLPGVKSLELDLGYRYSNYNLAGGAHTYKADANWEVLTGIRIRGGYARAVRAPSVGELFAAPSGSTPPLGEPSQGQGDYCSVTNPLRHGAAAADVRALCLAQGVPASQIDSFVNLQNDSDATSVGNRNLKPEKADTFTVGATFSPAFLNGGGSNLSFSVDYYDIRVKGAIGVVSSLLSVQKCFNVDGSNPSLSPTNGFCDNIVRDPLTGRIINVLQPTLNLGSLRTRGIDFAFNWQQAVGATGSVNLNSVVTYLNSFKVQTLPGGRFTEYAGTVGGTSTSQPGSLPKWKAVTTLTYGNELFTLGGRWRFINSMSAASRATNPNATTPGVPSYNLFDLFGEARVGKSYTIRAGINNLFDKDPLVLNGVRGTTEASTYDVVGRSLFVSIKLDLQ